MKTIKIDNYTFRIGKNSKENDDIIETSKNDDIWFHLTDYPSCHGVIDCPMKDLTSKIIFICASNIKNNTKFKKIKNIIVSYIEIENVSRTSVSGQVILKKNPRKIKV